MAEMSFVQPNHFGSGDEVEREVVGSWSGVLRIEEEGFENAAQQAQVYGPGALAIEKR